MALAKFLEDNQERLYASLEESRRQVNDIDENTSKQDLEFIKARLARELQLVQQQFDSVLEIVTNPGFDDTLERYDENKALEVKLKSAQSLIKNLRVQNSDIKAKLNEIIKENDELKHSVKSLTSNVNKHRKEACLLYKSLKESKKKFSETENELIHYKTKNYKLMADVDDLQMELEQTKGKLLTTHKMLDPNIEFSEILNKKDDLISKLGKALIELDQWCGMLEADLDMVGERPLELIIEQATNLNKSRPVKFTSYKLLAVELANKSIMLDENIVQIRDQKLRIDELKNKIERGQRYIVKLENEIKKLKSKQNIYEKQNSSISPQNNKFKKVKSNFKGSIKSDRKKLRKSNKTKASNIKKISSSLNHSSCSNTTKSSEEQYRDYIAKFEK